jgi:hypothetical protein
VEFLHASASFFLVSFMQAGLSGMQVVWHGSDL